MDSWICGPARGDFPSVSFPGASRARMVRCGEGATAPWGSAWRPRFPPRGRSGPLEAWFTWLPPVLHLAGDIDEWTFPYLTEVLARASRGGERRMGIDLTGVRYCDVAGLRAIVSLASGPGSGPGTIEQILLAHLPVTLRRLLRILGWDTRPGVSLDGCTC